MSLKQQWTNVYGNRQEYNGTSLLPSLFGGEKMEGGVSKNVLQCNSDADKKKSAIWDFLRHHLT
jgi:hypothetical protein